MSLTNKQTKMIAKIINLNQSQIMFVDAFAKGFQFHKFFIETAVNHVVEYSLNWNSLREAELYGGLSGEVYKLLIGGTNAY